jgi:photosystem II stability/assembly factor-like uncharacterized protein
MNTKYKNHFSVLLFLIITCTVQAQNMNPSLFNCMKWRMIGPHRGGRTVGACGVQQQPNVFYIGVNNGGVWKTTDYGRTWNPIFDDQPTGSIGDVAVAPSNPKVIYVGSGEGIQRPDLSTGDGMYKSVDAGKSWEHLGLSEGWQIGGLSVDPKNENRVFAAVLGHPYGPNQERGVYRSEDGGKTWKRVLFSDENTGAIQVCIDPVDPNIVYADLFASRQAPWENGEWQGAGSGLFKSTDGGTTWTRLSKGLPDHKDGLGRIGFCIAPSNHSRLYAVISSVKLGGIYRSDDAGQTWNLINDDLRLWDRGDDFAEIKADPKNADIVYTANVVVWKSADAGKTWTAFRGAPGGDDSHRLWFNPVNPDIILLAGDQGAIITVNGGSTWSSWYNQPTAQLYHVSADNAFPYNVYSGQQESGSVGIASRGNDGAVTYRDWHPVGAEEYGYVVADPRDANIIYGGKISKYDKRTGLSQDISPDPAHQGKYRFLRTAPIVFSTIDNKTLFFAGNVVFKTHDGGNSWKVISPDLTRSTYTVPENIGIYKTDSMKTMKRRGVVYTLALSPLDSNTLWAGTDDGLIQLTHDGGKKWENVTPPEVTDWSKISLMDASHSDIRTAYAAVNRIRLNDNHPHIYRTRDGGKTWKEIVEGLPADPINVVKEDPIRKGLLFAGSERAVYVSFDDGDHWQSLRMDMPATSIRDLIIKDNDLVVATHGRSFWILDDITPLRQLTGNSATVLSPAAPVILYKPAPAYRIRWDVYPDTPVPQEEPAGKNPPDGAIIDYYLKGKVNTQLTLDIVDSTGKLIRHFSSADTLYKIPLVNIPLYWIRPQQKLSTDSGSHRFLWDMRYISLNDTPTFPISAIYGETAPQPTSPWVMPGRYEVRLTANGQQYTQFFQILRDPRIHASTQALQQQHDLSYVCYADNQKVLAASKEISGILEQLKTLEPRADEKLKSRLNELSLRLDGITTGRKRTEALNFISLDFALRTLLTNIQAADAQPTSQTVAAVNSTHAEFVKLWKKWEDLATDLRVLNQQLGKAGLPMLEFGNN